MAIHFLSLQEIAEHLGVSFDTIKGYYRRGLLPDHDGEVGRNRGWLPETIDKWDSERPGAGARTDLLP